MKLFAFGLGYSARARSCARAGDRGERHGALGRSGGGAAERGDRGLRLRRRAPRRRALPAALARARHCADLGAAGAGGRSRARRVRARDRGRAGSERASSISRPSASTAIGTAAWVDETSPTLTRAPRGRWRLAAEAHGARSARARGVRRRRAAARRHLRARPQRAGQIARGRRTADRQAGQVFNRVHVDDIAGVLWRADRGRRAGRALERRRRGARAAAGRHRLRRRHCSASSRRRRSRSRGADCRRWRGASTKTTGASATDKLKRELGFARLSDLPRGAAGAGGGGGGARVARRPPQRRTCASGRSRAKLAHEHPGRKSWT